MAPKYPNEVKQKVLDFVNSTSPKEAVEKFPEISSSTIYRWAKEEKLYETVSKSGDEENLMSKMDRLNLNPDVDLFEKLKDLKNRDRLFINSKVYEFLLADFDHDEIIAEIHSLVKKGFHRPSEISCALKFVNVPQKRNDETVLQIFKNLQSEIKSLNELRESKEAKNVIVEFYGYTFCHDSWGRRTLLICMELLDFDLKALYQKFHTKDGHFPETFVSIIDALCYCRSKGIVHRDVKPSNILVKVSTGEIKLCDFGLSRIIANEDWNFSSMNGTIGYYAPEFLVNKKFNSRLDVWSLEITLLECIKGKPVLICKDGKSPRKHAEMKECIDLFHPKDDIDYYTRTNYSMNLNLFLNACLLRNHSDRPSYSGLKHYRIYQENKPTPKKAEEFQKSIISIIASINGV